MGVKRRRKEAMVHFDEVFELQERLGLNDREMSDLCGLEAKQYGRYKRRGLLPVERFLGAKDAVKVALSEKAFEIIDKMRAI